MYGWILSTPFRSSDGGRKPRWRFPYIPVSQANISLIVSANPQNLLKSRAVFYSDSLLFGTLYYRTRHGGGTNGWYEWMIRRGGIYDVLDDMQILLFGEVCARIGAGIGSRDCAYGNENITRVPLQSFQRRHRIPTRRRCIYVLGKCNFFTSKSRYIHVLCSNDQSSVLKVSRDSSRTWVSVFFIWRHYYFR